MLNAAIDISPSKQFWVLIIMIAIILIVATEACKFIDIKASPATTSWSMKLFGKIYLMGCSRRSDFSQKSEVSAGLWTIPKISGLISGNRSLVLENRVFIRKAMGNPQITSP